MCGIQYEGSNSYYETHVSKIEALSQTPACVKTSGTRIKKRKLKNLRYRRGIGTRILFKSEAKRWPISVISRIRVNRSYHYLLSHTNKLLITFAYKFCGLVCSDLPGVFGVND